MSLSEIIKKITGKYKSIINDNLHSPALSELLKLEEYNGAVVSNRFRYIFFAIASVSVFTNTQSTIAAGNTAGAIVNIASSVLYLFFTVFHTFILIKKKEKISRFFGYAVIIGDNFIFTVLLYLWWHIESPNNFNYFLKNYTMIFYLFPIIMTVFQFRIRLVVFSISIFILLYFSFILYGLHIGLYITNSWSEYLLGPGIVITDIITTRPAIYLCLAISIGYAIHRSIGMLRRIGLIESQKASLSRYFSPAVVNEITENPDIIAEGSRIKVTVLFCDIRDFTKMSENMSPHDLNNFLSDFRKRLTGAIFSNSGMIDKFIGDAIMAVFGAPHPSKEPGRDCKNAIAAALAMFASLEELNRERETAGIGSIRMGFGLHTGDVFAGNIGAEGQIEYTVIGDVVNTASRIEGLCKEFGASFIISQEVFYESGDMVHAEALPPVTVKGKEKPLQVYKLM